MTDTSARTRRRPELGFSILELVVALFIAVEILIAMAIAFDVHNKVAHVQLQITDMQQAQRIAQWDIARLVRQLGRGGMGADLAPGGVFVTGTTPPSIQGRALEVRNNVTGAAQYIARGDATSPKALEGTDILTVRGCFSTPLFQINSGTFDADSDDDGVAGDATGAATLLIPPVSIANVPQPYDDVEAELTAHPVVDGAKGYILIGSFVSSSDWGVAAVTAVGRSGDDLQLTLQLSSATKTPYSPLNPVVDGVRQFPTKLSATTACLLEEYRYYIRDVRETSDPITPLRPRLTRARFEPGTETAFEGDASNLELDLADQIFDLQIALGLDTDYGGSFDQDTDSLGADDTLFEAAADSASPGRSQDDWLYNSNPTDDPEDPGCDPTLVGCDSSTNPYLYHSWVNPADPTDSLVGVPVNLYLVRITTAARTFRPDNSYKAPDIDTRATGDWIEDHNLDAPPPSGDPDINFNSDDNRKHRRRTLTTVVEMRSI